jgi:hypothetical protein
MSYNEFSIEEFTIITKDKESYADNPEKLYNYLHENPLALAGGSEYGVLSATIEGGIKVFSFSSNSSSRYESADINI